MRLIRKSGVHNRALSKAHATPPATVQEARSRWGSFGDKVNLLQQLLNEQYRLCSYSELRADMEGIGYHIEHVRPKSKYPPSTFDYMNLTASALSSDDLMLLKNETFAGHAKRSEYDPVRFVSSLQTDCARYFRYLSDGRVVPSALLSESDQGKARYTIELLNLNSPYLTNRRRKWWEELDDLVEEHITDEMCLRSLAGVDLLPRNQALSPFFSLTRQFFGPIAEEVLTQEAPELL
ncbi:retron system putative HNH endonuclease [Pseudomonas akapageensis]|uniref:retron system putative HNH endonuclease n=1 Tax=Pseudomonas akapageensis TaxID=2609961 RepID=UPI00140C3ED8|nr:retron system putative HNH endonuclease [Pseudomonas akapageensis]